MKRGTLNMKTQQIGALRPCNREILPNSCYFTASHHLNSAGKLSDKCLSQASSGCPLSSRSRPSDLRPLAPSSQALGGAGRTALVSQYHTLSAHKQLRAGAPWEPLPSRLIKRIFYHINCFPLTSNSAWPAASTFFPLLTTLQQSPRLHASFSRPSSTLGLPWGQQTACIIKQLASTCKAKHLADISPAMGCSAALQRPGHSRAIVKKLL